MGDHGPRTTESFLAEAGPNTETQMKNRYLNLVVSPGHARVSDNADWQMR